MAAAIKSQPNKQSWTGPVEKGAFRGQTDDRQTMTEGQTDFPWQILR